MKVLTNPVACPYCKKLEKELKKAEISYETVDVNKMTDDVDKLRALASEAGVRSLPVVFLGTRIYGSGQHAFEEFQSNMYGE